MIGGIVRYHRLGIYWSTILYDALMHGQGGSYIVLGHPKTGSNWVSNLLSSYFDIPVFMPWIEWHPTTQPRVFHMHRILPFQSKDRRTVYVHRDGRDIVVSRYFAVLRDPLPEGVKDRADASRVLGSPMSEERIQEHLPKYIHLMEANRVSSVNYRTHHELCRDRSFVRVGFENLVEDTVGELTRVLQELAGSPPNPSRVASTVESNAFAETKKKPMTAHFLRKGKAGDWQNYFTRKAGRVYDEYAGDVLIELGYERDRSWIDRLPD